MMRRANTNRVLLLLVGIAIAVFIFWQTMGIDKATGNRLASQKVEMLEQLPFKSMPGILSKGKEIIKIIRSLGRQWD